LLLVEPDWIRVNDKASLWLDVADFERAYDLGRDASGQALSPGQVQAITAAVDLYQGDLLEGWYQDWLLYERERLQNAYLVMLDKLMAYCEAHGQYEMGIVYGTRVLRLDQARERTHRRLMRLHCLTGDRTAALRQYQRCVATLKGELGVGPTRRTRALYEQIVTDRLDDASPGLAESSRVPEPKSASLSEVLDRLQQFQDILEAMQRQVHTDIQVLQHASRRGSQPR
jgi:DNA-binding SARP family transcriptional activator